MNSLPNVLVVDDVALTRSLLRTALEETAQVIEAHDGERAIAILEDQAHQDIALVLLDYLLPTRSGLEILQEMRQRWPWIPVVLLTAFGSERLAVEAFRAGARDYLKKPISLDTLVHTIRTLTALACVKPARQEQHRTWADHRGRSTHPNIQRALAFIEKHFTEAITLADVAREAGLSRFHFCRLFHEENAVPFHDYLQGLRIDRAKTLLADRHTRVSEVAYAAGFNDLSHFDRTFRKIVGQSPTEYRAAERRNDKAG